MCLIHVYFDDVHCSVQASDGSNTNDYFKKSTAHLKQTSSSALRYSLFRNMDE